MLHRRSVPWVALLLLLLAACSGLQATPEAPLPGQAEAEASPAEAVPDGAFSVPNVSTVDELRAALLDADIEVIVLAAGVYAINDPEQASVNGELMVARPVTIRAAAGLRRDQVVIDAEPVAPAVGSRVMTLNPGADNEVVVQGLTIEGGRLSGANVNGAGILHLSGHLRLQDMNVLDNRTAVGSWGGGLRSNGQSVMVLSSLFEGNLADSGGGGMYVGSTIALVADSSFIANGSSNHGAALYVSAANGSCASAPGTTVVNSSFIDNTGLNTVRIFNGVADLHFITITGNTGDGLSSYQDSITCARIGHAIVADNSGSDILAQLGTQPITSLGYNLIGTTGSNVSFATHFAPDGSSVHLDGGDPELAPLANHGGPTPTMPPTLASPARNAGVPREDWSSYFAGFTVPLPLEIVERLLLDQRGEGFARPQLLRADIGAVERTPTVPALAMNQLGLAWVGQPITLQAVLPTPAGEPTPVGAIAFDLGHDACLVGLLPAGAQSIAECTTVFPAPGLMPLTLSYGGSADHQGSLLTTEINVDPAPSVALSFDPDPPQPGQPLVVGIQVAHHDGTPGSGTVNVALEGSPVASGSLAAGAITLTPRTLAAGVHEFDVLYQSDLAGAPPIEQGFRLDLADQSLLGIAIGPNGPSAPQLSTGSEDVVVAQLSLSALEGALRLERLRLQLSGPTPTAGLDVASLGRLSLHQDQNGNGRLDPGDAAIGSALVGGAGQLELVLDAPLEIGAGLSLRLLLLASPAEAQGSAAPLLATGAMGLLALFGLAGFRRAAGFGRGGRASWRRLLGLAMVLALLAACGGGGGATGSYVVEARIVGAQAAEVASGDKVVATGFTVALPSVTIRSGP